MRLVEAFWHVAGALGTTGLLIGGVVALEVWLNKFREKAFAEEVAVRLNIPVALMDQDPIPVQVREFLAARYDADLFRNRLSDAFAWVLLVWGVLCILAATVTIFWVVWLLVADGRTNAPGMWLVPAIAICSIVVGTAGQTICKLLTGRLPGQAMLARKQMLRSDEEQRIA